MHIIENTPNRSTPIPCNIPVIDFEEQDRFPNIGGFDCRHYMEQRGSQLYILKINVSIKNCVVRVGVGLNPLSTRYLGPKKV